MDDDRSNSLCINEFEKACKDYKMGMTKEDISVLFKVFDRNRDGTVEYNEFLRFVRGDLSAKRREIVVKAFRKLDRDQSGALEISDILGVYDATKHPAVIEGRKTEEQILGEFLETFETHHNIMNEDENDQMITLDEWVEYYTNISASIDDDEYFFMMMNNAWNLSGSADSYKKFGKGWAGEEDNASYTRTNRPPTGNPTLRSGMESSDGPFHTLDKYYSGNSPQRKSLANDKSDPQRMRSQITGEESQSNPLSSKGGEKYSKHDAGRKDLQQEKLAPSSSLQRTHEILLERFRSKLINKGCKGMIGLKRQFKLFDADGSGAIDLDEFGKAITDYKLESNPEEIEKLFDLFDADHSNTIDIDEFLNAIVPNLSEKRSQILNKVFQKLDSNQNGILEMSELSHEFDPTRHPDVKSG
jgi:Ca2+-binding EF-hand superfamily protein